MPSTTMIKNPVQTMDKAEEGVIARLNELHLTLQWRDIARIYEGIPAGSLSSYAKGRPVKNDNHRCILGLPPRGIMVQVWVFVLLALYAKPPRPRIYRRWRDMPQWAIRWSLENRESI